MQKYSGREYELRISRVKVDDKGEVLVRAENSFGRKEEKANLKVERKQIFSKNIKQFCFNKNDSVYF